MDNTAVQDGFQLYLHNFIVSKDGLWTVVQQGMSNESSTARRYHWHSPAIRSFVEEPHTGICGVNQGNILNMTATGARPSRGAMLSMSAEHPNRMLQEIRHLVMPAHHDVRAKDVDLKRLGAMLWLAHEKQPADFEELLLLARDGAKDTSVYGLSERGDLWYTLAL